MDRLHSNKRDGKRMYGIASVLSVSVLTILGLATGCESKEARLVQDWQAGCTKGDLGLCADLGDAYAKGIGTVRDPAKAISIYQDACKRGGRRSCMLLGLAYMEGNGVPKDPRLAAQILGDACESGDKDACVHGCDDLGEAVRCLRVGVLANKGGMDLQRAVAYYKKACDRGHPLGCREAALMLREGVGVAKDPDRASEMFKKADALMKTMCIGPHKPDYCEL